MIKRAYVDILEGQLHYQIAGTGEPVLLLHATQLSSEEYLDIIPILATGFQVLAVDSMGYGNSDMPAARYEIEDYARCIVHFLDALGIRRTNIVGNLTGAAIAVDVAASHPARVNKLVLCGCPYLDEEAREARLKVWLSKRMVIKDDGSHLAEWWEDRRARTPYLKPEVWQLALANYLKCDLGRRTEDGHIALYRYDIRPKLSMIESPTLLAVGSESMFASRLESTRQLIRSCQTKVLDGVHNHPTWEDPVAFAQSVLEFLATPTKC